MKLDSGIVKMLIVVFAITIIVALILRHVMEKKGLYDPVPQKEQVTSEVIVDEEETEPVMEKPVVSAGNGYDKTSSDKADTETSAENNDARIPGA